MEYGDQGKRDDDDDDSAIVWSFKGRLLHFFVYLFAQAYELCLLPFRSLWLAMPLYSNWMPFFFGFCCCLSDLIELSNDDDVEDLEENKWSPSSSTSSPWFSGLLTRGILHASVPFLRLSIETFHFVWQLFLCESTPPACTWLTSNAYGLWFVVSLVWRWWWWYIDTKQTNCLLLGKRQRIRQSLCFE